MLLEPLALMALYWRAIFHATYRPFAAVLATCRESWRAMSISGARARSPRWPPRRSPAQPLASALSQLVAATLPAAAAAFFDGI